MGKWHIWGIIETHTGFRWGNLKGKRLISISSNGAPWARPGAMPRGPKWGGCEFCAPPKKGPGSVAHF